MTNKELAVNCKKAFRSIDEDLHGEKAKWQHFSEAFNEDPIYRIFELANHWSNDLDDWCDEILST